MVSMQELGESRHEIICMDICGPEMPLVCQVVLKVS